MVEHVYKVIDIIGSSEISWEDAAKRAIEEASKSLQDLRIGEVRAQDVQIENGKVIAYRTKLSVSFRYHEGLSHRG